MIKPTFIESIKILDGRIYNLLLHQQRMEITMKFHFGSRVFPQLDEIIDIPQEYRNGYVKCRILYSEIIMQVEFQPYLFRSISNLTLVEDDTINYQFKYENRIAIDRLKEKVGRDKEILIVKNGQITDTSFSNVVFESPSGLYTPSSCLLAGIKRKLLLDQGIIKERKIGIDNLKEYTKVHLINAMIDMEDTVGIPISQIEPLMK